MSIRPFKPGIRLIYVALSLCVLGLITSIYPALQFNWLLASSFVFVISVYDLLLAYRYNMPEIERVIPSSLAVGVNQVVKIRLTNKYAHRLNCDVYDHFPESVNASGLPRELCLRKSEVAELNYQVTPLQRGVIEFPGVECQIQSPMALWSIKYFASEKSTARVFPNYAPVIEYAMLSVDNHLSMMGILKKRRRGQGMDFHQLREFREGDSTRQIDWKASSRMRKLIAREYQDERDQQVVIMMDCGHRMLAHDGQLSHFDHSLNAMLLLSYVALRQGDSVGFSSFSHNDRRWIKPVKGVTNINMLINGVYDLQPSANSPDYSSGARDLLMHQRKRSLVLILTNLRDDDQEDLGAAVKLLKKYHKVVVASLQEKAIHETLDSPVRNLDDALTVSATHSYLYKRSQFVRYLRNSGINTLDVLPEDLPLELTNHYLNLKASGQI